MDSNLIILATYESVLSLFTAVFTILVTAVLTEKIFFRENLRPALLSGNVAIGLFIGAAIFGVLLNVRGSIEPAVNLLQTKMMGNGGDVTFSIFISSLGQFIIFYLIAFAISFVLLSAILGVVFLATKGMSETTEMKNGNLSISVLFSLLIVGICVFVSPATKNLVGSLVNYKLVQEEARTNF